MSRLPSIRPRSIIGTVDGSGHVAMTDQFMRWLEMAVRQVDGTATAVDLLSVESVVSVSVSPKADFSPVLASVAPSEDFSPV